MTAGLDDEYTPPESIFALAAAGRVPVIEPVIEPIELFDVYGVEPAGIPPYSGNVAGGRQAPAWCKSGIWVTSQSNRVSRCGTDTVVLSRAFFSECRLSFRVNS